MNLYVTNNFSIHGISWLRGCEFYERNDKLMIFWSGFKYFCLILVFCGGRGTMNKERKKKQRTATWRKQNMLTVL
jgi:hypothetical protein